MTSTRSVLLVLGIGVAHGATAIMVPAYGGWTVALPASVVRDALGLIGAVDRHRGFENALVDDFIWFRATLCTELAALVLLALVLAWRSRAPAADSR